MPLVAVFAEALRKGVAVYLAAIVEPDALSAIRLTLVAAAIAVPLNLVFGVAAAWAIAKFDFRGKNLLITLHRPAVLGVAGGRRPDLRAALRRCRAGSAPWLRDHDIKIIFAVPGIVLATIFVTFPFVARELIPLMQAQGTERRRRRACSAPAAGRSSGA